jgi:hypothetical protein
MYSLQLTLCLKIKEIQGSRGVVGIESKSNHFGVGKIGLSRA